MSSKITFHFINFDGSMELNVGMFFGTMPASKIKKVLQMVHKYCPVEKRQELLIALIDEDKKRKELLYQLGDMEFKREQLLKDFIDESVVKIKRDLASPEKSLLKQRKKLQAAISAVKEMK